MKKPLIILIIGLILLNGCGKSSQKEEIICNVGNIKTMPTPYGVAGGPIIGIEEHKLMNGETKKLCCSEVQTSPSGKKLKVCSSSKEGIIEYDLIWQYINGRYVKLREFIPQAGGHCTYNYDSSGNIKDRYCK